MSARTGSVMAQAAGVLRPGPPLPERIQTRVDEFHQVRIGQEWGGRHILRGRRPGPDAILVDSTDYLSLRGDSRITEAIRENLAEQPTAPRSSGELPHTDDHPQLHLEADLARHVGAAGGVLCQSGWAATAGLFQAIADPSTPVYLDVLAHLSLWQGARGVGAPVRGFRHNDPEHLRSRIADHGPGIIAVDSVYSTNGSVCPLAEVGAVARDTGSVLVVDESHSLGTHGPHGEGLVAGLGLVDLVHFRVASLATAFAGRAGFVAGGGLDFVEYFRLVSYPAVFSAALLPHELAGLAATLRVVRADDWRRVRLHRIANQVRTRLTELGYDLDGSSSQLIALPTGPDLRAIAVRDLLESRGVFGSVFFPPATARNRTLIRLSLHATLTDAQVDRIVAVCADVRDELSIPDQRRRPV